MVLAAAKISDEIKNREAVKSLTASVLTISLSII